MRFQSPGSQGIASQHGLCRALQTIALGDPTDPAILYLDIVTYADTCSYMDLNAISFLCKDHAFGSNHDFVHKNSQVSSLTWEQLSHKHNTSRLAALVSTSMISWELLVHAVMRINIGTDSDILPLSSRQNTLENSICRASAGTRTTDAEICSSYMVMRILSIGRDRFPEQAIRATDRTNRDLLHRSMLRFYIVGWPVQNPFGCCL